MIYVTGDTHGDPERLSRAALKPLRDGDTLIVCGDFGYLWDGSRREQKLLQKLSRKKIEICFIDGAHENFSLLEACPVVNYRGGKARRIAPNIHHLMRGQLFEIEGRTVFAFGGGENPDLELKDDGELDRRRPEVPTGEEMREGIENMDRVGYMVDYIVTHEPPAGVRAFLTLSQSTAPTVSALGAYFDELSVQAHYKKWFFGSLHMDKSISASSVCVFEKLIPAGD